MRSDGDRRHRSWRASMTAARCAVAAALALGGATGCGSQGSRLKVAAAASLQAPFKAYAHQLGSPHVSYSFAGSDAIAAQIEQGLRPDVFASADTQLAQTLYEKGLVAQPVAFASNRLVLAVPTSSSIRSLQDIARPRVTIALGTAGVPIGLYANAALQRLPAGERRVILANVKDRESDVSGIVARLTEGAVDVGIVYRTDVIASRGALRAVELPPALQPPISYAIAIVRGTHELGPAHRFVNGILTGTGASDLRRAGFLAAGA
jgi:molybdate transport system substrate-binding protein